MCETNEELDDEGWKVVDHTDLDRCKRLGIPLTGTWHLAVVDDRARDYTRVLYKYPARKWYWAFRVSGVDGKDDQWVGEIKSDEMRDIMVWCLHHRYVS